MTTYDPQVKVVLDSVSPDGIRLSTVQWRHPRMIHADFLTHRLFSRNGRSSRAVPSVTLLEEARNPYVPHFMRNEPGMVANEEFSSEEFAEIEAIWRDMAEYTRLGVEKLAARKVHKQWANRPLEWFGYIDVLVTSTEWANFFALRDEKGAQPEIRDAAQAVREALQKSTPTLLQPGDWHLPYITAEDWEEVERYLEPYPPETHPTVDVLKKISAARCARLTIKPFDGNGSIEKELERYNRLITSAPVHASPVEHQATPDTKSMQRLQRFHEPMGLRPGYWETIEEGRSWDNPTLHGNFIGWIQNRKMIPNEAVW